MRKYAIKWALLIAGVLVVIAALVLSRMQHSKSLCKGAQVVFNVEPSQQFVTEAAILKFLNTNNFTYKGKVAKEIDLNLAEAVLSQQPFIRKVDCFIDLRNILNVHIEQRKPILRVYPKFGSPYYIDEDGGTFPLSNLFSADVIVASGNITSAMNKKLYTTARTVHQSAFWYHFIEHIFVENNGDLAFTTQISGHKVVLGDTLRMENKLTKLELFYQKALVNMGWDQFKEIHLEYKDQVICRK